MEAALKVEVISREFVKPSHPTILPLSNTITLSFLDESFPAIHFPNLLFYDTATTVATKVPPFNDLITTLKTSLSETLTHFPPLAGRFENVYTVSCNDEGIPFIATRVNCNVRDFLTSPRKFDLLGKFLPPQEFASLGQHPVSEVAPLAFQVNVFQCGGVVIGCWSIHKLIDATSMSCFLNYWAATASKRVDDLVEPDFDAIIKAFPSLPKEKREAGLANVGSTDGNGSNNKATTQPAVVQVGLSQHANLPIKVVAKSFKFSNAVIMELKANAASDDVPNPSSFEVVAGFVWKHAMEAASHNDNKDDNNDAPLPITNTLSFTASLRSRTSPPLSKQTMGNIIAAVYAHVTGPDAEPAEFVREIHESVGKVKHRVAALQAENGGEAFLAERKAEFQASARDKASIFTLTSWCKAEFNQVDFGFGKLSKIIPLGIIYPFQRNNMSLVDYSDPNGEEGIEVFVCLEENQMPYLEANPQFLAFASPS